MTTVSMALSTSGVSRPSRPNIKVAGKAAVNHCDRSVGLDRGDVDGDAITLGRLALAVTRSRLTCNFAMRAQHNLPLGASSMAAERTVFTRASDAGLDVLELKVDDELAVQPRSREV